MKIEVWSDFVCPFCYIGKRRLEMALSQFPHRDLVEVEFKSFELDPNASLYSGKSIHEALAEKYRMSIEQAEEANKNIGLQAASVGLTFNFDTMKPTNTFDAHRLAKLAKERGKEKEVTEKLLHGYFTDSIDLGDYEVLADIAQSAGIARDEAIATLEDKNAYANEVRMDESVAQAYRITGVPFFIINQKYSISGAQPLETFMGALQKVWEEENPVPVFEDLSGHDAKDASCVDGNCIIPNDHNE